MVFRAKMMLMTTIAFGDQGYRNHFDIKITPAEALLYCLLNFNDEGWFQGETVKNGDYASDRKTEFEPGPKVSKMSFFILLSRVSNLV
jgi:hypothetical protein